MREEDSAIRSKEEEYAVLVEIGKALTSTLNLEEILETVIDKIRMLVNPRSWSLLLVDDETGELVFAKAISSVGAQLEGMRLPRGTGIAGWVAEHGEPLLVPDVSMDPRFSAAMDRNFSFTTRSIVCIPLRCRRKVVGVIQLINSIDEGSFREEDLPILEAIADFTGIAVDNARNLERINTLAITDDLTGLFNSRQFREMLEYEIARSIRFGGEVSLVFIDLDRFKPINDRYGHLVGSRVLAELGRLIGKSLRKVDRAFRYGGDEFVLILPGTPKEGGRVVARNILDLIRNHRVDTGTGETAGVTASLGIATYPDDASRLEDLIKAADCAMYRVKESGRDAVWAVGDPEPATPPGASPQTLAATLLSLGQ